MKRTGGIRVDGEIKQSAPDQPLVSIITVVYNGENTIERTIKSVIGQDYPNIEYIIIDAESSDSTMNIVEGYADRVDYYISEPDEGIYDAMNKGIKHANGEIIGIINSDDWYESETVKKIVHAYMKDKGSVCCGLLRHHDSSGPIEISTYYPSRLKEHMISHPTCFVSSCLYEKHGGFDTGYKIVADYDLMLRFHINGVRFVFIEEVLANFTVGGACQSNNYKAIKEVVDARLANKLITANCHKKTMIKVIIKNYISAIKEFILR